MAENLKDILSNLSTDIDQETLLLYLQGKLSEEQRHEVEKQMLDNDFNEDALEGLSHVQDKEKLSFVVEMLNRDLKKKTEKNKLRREKMKLKDQTWLYICVAIILLLIILSYFVLHRMMNKPG